MTKLLQLPLKVAALAVRTSAHLVEVALDRVRGDSGAEEERWTPVTPPSSSAPAPPRAPRTEAAPVVTPVPEPPVAEPPAAAIPEPPPVAVPEPTPGDVARLRARRRAAETTAESPGPEIHVEEPWQGYAAMNAPEIIDRLGVSDDAVKAIVVLYERSHRARKTVLRAAGG